MRSRSTAPISLPKLRCSECVLWIASRSRTSKEHALASAQAIGCLSVSLASSIPVYFSLTLRVASSLLCACVWSDKNDYDLLCCTARVPKTTVLEQGGKRISMS